MSKIEHAKKILEGVNRPHPLTGEINPQATSRAFALAAAILKWSA